MPSSALHCQAVLSWFCFVFFLQQHPWHMEFPAEEQQLGPTPQSQQHWIQALSSTYAIACGNIGALTH